MSSGIAVTNTLGFLFPDNAAQPTLAEMVRFVKGLAGTQGTMNTAYKNAEERSVFIKYKTEEGMREALELNRKKLPFHYTNGTKVNVCMSVAGNNIQYVRIFDLPPEVSDHDLSLVLKKYGKIKRCVREKYPPEYQLDLFTGVRGIYMDVENEIPSVLYFLNRRGRVFYNGNKLKCFACGQEGHHKIACGKRKNNVVDAANNSFAEVLVGAGTSDKQTVDLEIEVLEEEEEDACVAPATTVNNDLDNSGQQNKQQQQQIQTILHYQQQTRQQPKRSADRSDNATVKSPPRKKIDSTTKQTTSETRTNIENECTTDENTEMETVSERESESEEEPQDSDKWLVWVLKKQNRNQNLNKK